MDEMEKYIKRFFLKNKKNTKYGMKFKEMQQGIEEIFCVTDMNRAFKIITTFFNFGYAKGYRAAMAEMKKSGKV